MSAVRLIIPDPASPGLPAGGGKPAIPAGCREASPEEIVCWQQEMDAQFFAFAPDFATAPETKPEQKDETRKSTKTQKNSRPAANKAAALNPERIYQ